MKLFVTGGTGFIGSYFINAAITNGHDLLCLRRSGSQARINIPIEPLWLNGDLGGDFISQMKGCEIFVHMAACGVSPQKATKAALFKVNLTDSYKLIQSAISAGIKKILVLGTSDEYGRAAMDYQYIPTNAPLEPISDYAASKAALFQMLHDLSIKKEIKLIYARIFSAYGIGQYKNNLWPSLRTAALSGKDYSLSPGEQIRTFIPVGKVAEKLVDLLEFSNIKDGEPVIKHIGTNLPQTVRMFAEYWWKKWGSTGKLHFGVKPYRPNEIMRLVPLIEKY